MLEKNENNIAKIVLTGGPCAGKTTILKELAEYLENNGYYVITIPETATELIKSKILPASGREHTLMFQNIVLQQQYIKEKVAEEYAKSISKNNKIVILYDRAIFDNRAYLESDDDFELLLNNNKLDELSLLNNYDLVIDLISTANSKKDSYQLDDVRSESVEEAAILDIKTSMAWIHHDNLKIVKPTENIIDKVTKVICIVDKYLNNREYNDKKIYELDNTSDLSIYTNDNSKKIDIHNIKLNNEIVITKKSYRNSSIFICNSEIITKNQFAELICLHKVISVELIKEFICIEDSNIYKIFKQNNQLHLELEMENTLKLPNNLFLSKNKTFVKK